MHLRAAVAAVLAAVAWASIAAASADDEAVAVLSFNYVPETVEIAAGESVVWSNLDPVEHTVSADDGSFESGRLRPGQRFQLRFLRPGTYAYFCQPHDFMRGFVVVTGATEAVPTQVPARAGPPPSIGGAAPGTTTTSPPVPGPVATEVAATPPVAEPPPVTAAAAAAPATSDAAVLGRPDGVPPLPVGAGVVGLAAVLVAAARDLRRLAVERALCLGASFLTIVSALVHLQLRATVDYPEPVATLLFAHGAAGLVVAAYLLFGGRFVALVAWAHHAAALAAFVASRRWSLLGFRELGWYPAPQAALAVGAACGALAMLAAALLRAKPSRATAPIG